MVERKEYLEELKRWKEKDLIKVVTGIRRCGKSTLFDLFIDYLKSIGCEKIMIAVSGYNENAIKFYEKNGYHMRMIDMIED